MAADGAANHTWQIVGFRAILHRLGEQLGPSPRGIHLPGSGPGIFLVRVRRNNAANIFCSQRAPEMADPYQAFYKAAVAQQKKSDVERFADLFVLGSLPASRPARNGQQRLIRFSELYERAMCELPCGCGKSVAIGLVMQNLVRRRRQLAYKIMLVFTQRHRVAMQTRADVLQSIGCDGSAARSMLDGANPDSVFARTRFLVCENLDHAPDAHVLFVPYLMLQANSSVTVKQLENLFARSSVVFFDEAHEAAGTTKLRDAFENAARDNRLPTFVYGLSATYQCLLAGSGCDDEACQARTQQARFKQLFPAEFVYSVSEAHRNGEITIPRIVSIDVSYSSVDSTSLFDGVYQSRYDKMFEDIARRDNNLVLKLLTAIVKHCLSKNKKVMICSFFLEPAEILHKHLVDSGVQQVWLVHGDNRAGEKQETWARIMHPNNACAVVSTQVLDTGVDIPDLRVVVDFTYNSHYIPMQRCGRVMRRVNGPSGQPLKKTFVSMHYGTSREYYSYRWGRYRLQQTLSYFDKAEPDQVLSVHPDTDVASLFP